MNDEEKSEDIRREEDLNYWQSRLEEQRAIEPDLRDEYLDYGEDAAAIVAERGPKIRSVNPDDPDYLEYREDISEQKIAYERYEQNEAWRQELTSRVDAEFANATVVGSTARPVAEGQRVVQSGNATKTPARTPKRKHGKTLRL